MVKPQIIKTGRSALSPAPVVNALLSVRFSEQKPPRQAERRRAARLSVTVCNLRLGFFFLNIFLLIQTGLRSTAGVSRPARLPPPIPTMLLSTQRSLKVSLAVCRRWMTQCNCRLRLVESCSSAVGFTVFLQHVVCFSPKVTRKALTDNA